MPCYYSVSQNGKWFIYKSIPLWDSNRPSMDSTFQTHFDTCQNSNYIFGM